MRILFATDGSSGSDIALDLLRSLRLRAEDQVEVLTVISSHYAGLGIEAGPALAAEAAEQEEADAREIAEAAAARLAASGTKAAARTAEGPAAEAIIAAAATTASDLIVIGSRGRGLLAGALLGSTARALARHSPVAVLIVRDRREAPRRILIAIDGSADSSAALAALAAIPLPRGAEVVLLHVVPRRVLGSAKKPLDHELMAGVERQDRVRALELLRRAAGELPPHVSMRVEVEQGTVADRVLAVASGLGIDLIVLGSRGTSLGAGFLQGSTADRVLSGAHCAVLVARAAERVKAEQPARAALVAAAAV